MLMRNVSLCLCEVVQKCDYSSIWCEMKNNKFDFVIFFPVGAQSQWQRPTTPNYEGQPHALVGL